jgi:gluconokinase
VSPSIVIMGVSGCGKSTLGMALATALGVPFIEGDDMHPPANVEKMRRGEPLDDRDREPFLGKVADALAAAGPRGGVATCSALKRAYRDLIRRRAGAVTFVWPRADRAVIALRMQRRRDHYMPVTLLDSQLATLEAPAADEHVIEVDGAAPTAAQVATVLTALRNDRETRRAREAPP